MNLDLQNLPVYQRADEITRCVLNNPVVLLTGETGSGKTTQLPQILADAKLLSRSDSKPLSVVCVQPHRVAAISIAKKVAEERGVELGKEVGYVVRWDSMVTPGVTHIKYCTDGILLRECVDREFQDYDVVIIDEAHERSANVDLLIALAKRVLTRKFAHRRPEDIPIRFIVTSATLNIAKFVEFFPQAPVLKIPGRNFAVRKRHVPVRIHRQEEEEGGASRPADKNVTVKFDKEYGGINCIEGTSSSRRRRKMPDWLSSSAAISASVLVACRIHTNTPVSSGHILAFMSGAQECERAVKETYNTLAQLGQDGETVAAAAVIPLYGTLEARQQANVFVEVPADCRKIVFATNVAETSLTIPGIGHVIDTGTVKQTFFRQETGVSSLERIPISKAQAEQRAGRAGRTRHGNCWRLYSEEMYEQMPDEPTPELLRTDPSTALLSLLAMRIRDVLTFEFLDAPDRKQLALGLRSLALLGALEPRSLQLTRIGKAMSYIPVEPIYARCLLSAISLDVVPEIATIVALLSAGPVCMMPRFDRGGSDDQDDEDLSDTSSLHEDGRGGDGEMQQRPEQMFDSLYKNLRDPKSDHITYINMMREFNLRSGREATDWCLNHSLSYKTMITAHRIQYQLLESVAALENSRGQEGGDPEGGRPLREGDSDSHTHGPPDTHSHTGNLERRPHSGYHRPIAPGEWSCLLAEGVHGRLKRDRIIEALASGLFMSAACLSISRSGKILGWSLVRDGVIIHPASESVFSLAEDESSGMKGKGSPPAEWILASNIQQHEGTGIHQQLIFRCASAVSFDLIKPLISRMRDISLADLLMDLEDRPKDQDLCRSRDEIHQDLIQQRRDAKFEAIRSKLRSAKKLKTNT